jgi:hypothetical protein
MFFYLYVFYAYDVFLGDITFVFKNVLGVYDQSLQRFVPRANDKGKKEAHNAKENDMYVGQDDENNLDDEYEEMLMEAGDDNFLEEIPV